MVAVADAFQAKAAGSVANLLDLPLVVVAGSFFVRGRGDADVLDNGNDRVQKFDARGRFLTQFGVPTQGATHTVMAVAEADDGSVFVTSAGLNPTGRVARESKEVLQELGLKPEFFHTTPQEEAKALDRADLVLAIKEEEAAWKLWKRENLISFLLKHRCVDSCALMQAT